MTSEDRIKLTERIMNTLGVPSAILIVLGFGVWRLAQWSKPYIESAFDAHISLVKSSERAMLSLDQKVDTLVLHDQKLSESLAEVGTSLNSLVTEIRRDRQESRRP